MKTAPLADYLKMVGLAVQRVEKPDGEARPTVYLNDSVWIKQRARRFVVVEGGSEVGAFSVKDRAALFAATLAGVTADFEVKHYEGIGGQLSVTSMQGCTFEAAVNEARRKFARCGGAVYVGLPHCGAYPYGHSNAEDAERFAPGVVPVPMPEGMPRRRKYTVAVTLAATVEVAGVSEEDTASQVCEMLSQAQLRHGVWADGAPIVLNVSTMSAWSMTERS